ncbi:MAG: sulfatase-like hydrolase/transferase [Planctomycetales bacterium]|nr:sulfatase-like hydrolase/transferase [Planctomycetales bacterium]
MSTSCPPSPNFPLQLARKFSVVLWLALIVGSGALARADERPNILFIFADDQAFDTIGALGNDEVETPNLDQLVRRGATFTRAYNQGSWSGAVCVASRTMLVTGRYLWHANEVYGQTDKLFRQQQRLWPQLLEAAGYETYFSGKWHIRADAQQAFSVCNHVRPGMPKQTPQGYNRPQDGKPDVWSPYDPKFGGFWEGGKHWSEVLGDDGVDYLSRAAKSDKPFFMYLAFNAPHDPRQSPKEYVDNYPLDKISIPKSFVPEYPLDIGANRIRDEQLAPFPRTEHSIKVNRQEYYAIITHLDVQVGRILEALEKSGKADNTYIFFTADHGLAVGRHGLMGKQNMFDHSIRVPFMVVGPNIQGGQKVESPIYLQDAMATSLDLAGIEKPKHVEFQSVMPLLRGDTSGARDAIYSGYLEVQRAVTYEGYKLILYPKIKAALLYHLDQDPLELRDLMGDESSRVIAKRLFKKLQQLQVETGDQLKLEKDYPELAAS